MHCPTTDQLDPDLINTRLDSTGSETVADRVTPDDQLLPCTYLDGYCAHCDDLV